MMHSRTTARKALPETGGWTRDGFIARAWHALDMAFQPIVLVRSGEVYGYEALMRGHENLGMESIQQVLDTAHALGQADRLHLVLLEKSLKKLAGLGEVGEKKLFFNLDGRALEGEASLHEETDRLLETYGLEPSCLCLEFSETYDYASAVEVAEMVAEHRSRGIRFAIDDFGRGFSELKVLYEYHPEFIKIDRFFVNGMVSDSRKRLFVSTLVNLAHVLGIRIVVEGVESEEEYEQSRQLGCDLVQGFFVAPPLRDFPEGHVAFPHLNLLLNRGRSEAQDTDCIIADRIEKIETVSETARMCEVFETFRFSRIQSVFPVLDSQGEPKGIVREIDLKEFNYSPYGRDLLKNVTFTRKLSDFVRQCPIAERSLSAEAILDIFAYQDCSDGIIITENCKYAGFLSAVSLLEVINDRRLEDARDQNPLSKLPGNASITSFSEQTSGNPESDRVFCYIDFDNFKPFNDAYSFREGDRAIMMFADLLKQQFADSRFMIGHVGGDDFFVGAHDVPHEELTSALARLRATFSKNVASLYTAEDREAGHIQARDRYGKWRTFPLLSCSIAVVKIPKGQAGTTDALLREIARVKRKAKNSNNGLAQSIFCYERPSKAGGHVAAGAPGVQGTASTRQRNSGVTAQA